MLQVRSVDPRDVRWELDDPVYRVHFWTDGQTTGSMACCDEYEVTGARAAEVLRWADARRVELGADRYDAYVLVRGPGDLGAVRIG